MLFFFLTAGWRWQRWQCHYTRWRSCFETCAKVATKIGKVLLQHWKRPRSKYCQLKFQNERMKSHHCTNGPVSWCVLQPTESEISFISHISFISFQPCIWLVVCGFLLITDQSGSLTYLICIVLPERCIPLSQLIWRKQVHNIGQAFEGISPCVVGVCEFVMEVFYFFSLQPELSYVWYWYHSRKRNWTPCCHWYQLFSW